MADNFSDIRGLSDDEVSERIQKGLVNGDFNVPSKSVKQIFKDNCLTFFNFLNVVLAACVVAVGAFKNCLFLGVILCNTAIGIFQEIRSKRAVDRLALLSAPKAVVLRNGQRREIAVKDIVLDDIMILSAGKQVCSDCEIINGECEVNESLITGESDPIVKRVGDEVLSGSYIVSSEVCAKVIRVGADNYANKITAGAKYLKKSHSEMLSSINYVLKVIAAFIIPIIILMFGKELLIAHSPFTEAVVNTVSAVIGMIPEGLVLMASMVLAVSVIRLATHKTLAQDLYCVETLARVDVLCLDKTGTITEGIMEVADVISLDGTDHEEELKMFVGSANDSNPTYMALRDRFAADSDMPDVKIAGVIPFSSEKKWSLSAYEGRGTYIMGAAEFVLGDALSDELRQRIENEAEGGYRVLLFSRSDALPDFETKTLPSGIKPLCLIKITDKIRAEAPDTLNFFAQQGVDIRIISGDSPKTVSGVAQRAGLQGYDKYIDASTIKTDEELHEAAEKYKIFGRVTPYQKLELVKALKAAKHTVAMTGDGVNDVLALKEADCSIAMQSGSDAARNVSNIVLLDSNFASMPKIVGEGRRSINNIERSGILFLYKTVYSFLVSLIFCFVPMSYPMQAIQLTQINIFTNGIPSFLLAMEPNFNIVKGKFIENVLPRSVLYGLIITMNYVGIIVARLICNATGFMPFAAFDAEIQLIATITTAFSAFVILFMVCQPLKIWKGGLLIFLVSGFALDIWVLGSVLLDLSVPSSQAVIIMILLAMISVVLGALARFLEKPITAGILSIQRGSRKLLEKFDKKKKA